MNLGKGPSGVITGIGHFDYLPDPSNPNAKLALALYREGLSANLVPYQFLGFFKVINVIHRAPQDQTTWIRANLQHIRDSRAKDRLAELARSHADVAEYLFVSGRCAVAHAFTQPVVNPDDPADLLRLDQDLPLIKDLARIAIERELGVISQDQFHEEHLYELAGFRLVLGPHLVGRLRDGVVPAQDVHLPRLMTLRLRDRPAIAIFESMIARIDRAEWGIVRIRLESADSRVCARVVLNFAEERLMFEPLTDVEAIDDGTAEGAQAELDWAQFHRWSFGSNGTLEVYDSSTLDLLGRGQPYMAPPNLRFPHEEFEKMEAELRARIGPPVDPKVGR